MPSLNQISAITSKGEIQIDFLKKVCYNKNNKMGINDVINKLSINNTHANLLH
jgi:hypothetical protein